MEDVQKILMGIKEALGGIQSDLKTIKENMNILCNFKDEANERLSDLENKTQETTEKLETHVTGTEGRLLWLENDAVRNKILLKSFVGAWSIFVAIAVILWAIYKQLGITFTLG